MTAAISSEYAYSCENTDQSFCYSDHSANDTKHLEWLSILRTSSYPDSGVEITWELHTLIRELVDSLCKDGAIYNT